eukprot:TRINITY_DN3268_c0_g1_i1.p1 TRINITY_DN3268_c0_g1~~TRINITY_DN3268_c0_g1_i1.p1  ORF type:complete len:671 (-),score=79.37 TRINITY_DN3268_c0_g1_i1:32-2044(-)
MSALPFDPTMSQMLQGASGVVQHYTGPTAMDGSSNAPPIPGGVDAVQASGDPNIGEPQQSQQPGQHDAQLTLGQRPPQNTAELAPATNPSEGGLLHPADLQAGADGVPVGVGGQPGMPFVPGAASDTAPALSNLAGLAMEIAKGMPMVPPGMGAMMPQNKLLGLVPPLLPLDISKLMFPPPLGLPFGTLPAQPPQEEDENAPQLVSRRTRSCGPRVGARQKTQQRDKERIQQILAAGNDHQAQAIAAIQAQHPARNDLRYQPEAPLFPLTGGVGMEGNSGSGGKSTKSREPQLFSDLVFFVTGYPPEEVAEIREKIEVHDGQCSTAFAPDITHVLAKYACKETQRALEEGKAICSKPWLKACLNKKAVLPTGPGTIPSHLPLPSMQPVPGFCQLNVSVTGWSDKPNRWMRGDTQYLIDALGAKLHPTLSREVDILVAQDGIESDKLTKAFQWNLCVVSHEWIFRCVREWKMVNMTPFVRRPPRQPAMDLCPIPGPGGMGPRDTSEAVAAAAVAAAANSPGMGNPSMKPQMLQPRDAATIAAALGNLAPIMQGLPPFPGVPSDPLRNGNPLGATLQQQLNEWLRKGDLGLLQSVLPPMVPDVKLEPALVGSPPPAQQAVHAGGTPSPAKSATPESPAQGSGRKRKKDGDGPADAKAPQAKKRGRGRGTRGR